MAPFQNGAMLPSREAKWGHTALPGGQYGLILPKWGHIALQGGQYGPNLPHGAKKEGEVFRMIQGGQYGPILAIATSRTRKEEGGGEAFLPSGRANCVLETPFPAWSKEGKGGNSCSREDNLGTGDSKSRME